MNSITLSDIDSMNSSVIKFNLELYNSEYICYG